MNICKQGNGHYLSGINNQDFFYQEGTLKLVTDGCSEGEFSEVGTRLFCQIFSRLESRFEVDKFEENVHKAFCQMRLVCAGFTPEQERDFIINNMLFTIIACFELEDKFVVKVMGDGYIISVNKVDMVSFMRLFYGKTPPYYAYRSVDTQTYEQELKFKTFEFSKADFKKIGIATDGIAPLINKRLESNIDQYFLERQTKYSLEGIIKSNQSSFFDDVTVLV